MTNPNDLITQERANRAAQAGQDWHDENHRLGGVCDFCADPLADDVTTWLSEPIVEVIAVLDTETLGTGTIGHVQSDDWAACPNCDAVIALRDPERLADYVIDHPGSRAPEIPAEFLPTFRAELVDLYTKFFAGGARRARGDAS